MEFKPIVLQDKKEFDRYVKGHHYMNSESSFANLYIWQHAWNIEMAATDRALFISSDGEMNRPFLLVPFLLDPSESIAPYMEMAEDYMYARYGDFYMKSATNDLVEKINRDCPGRYEFRYDEDNSEYVYNTSDLENLSGKRYHGKRNHISGFLRNHYPATAAYHPKYRDECLLLQEEWAKTQQENRIQAEFEYISIMKALDNYEELGLKGLVVLLHGRVAAFTMGELLTPEMALIHIEKARRDVNGLFPYINQQFVQRDWRDTRYINREEDMGVEGIRQAKRSYRPAFMVDKFDVLPRRGRKQET